MLLTILKEILEYLKPLSRLHQSFHFSVWIVPAFIFIFWYYSLAEEGTLDKMRDNIALIPMKSIVHQDGHITDKAGTLIFIKDTKEDYRIPLNDSSRCEIWTSLDKETMRINDNRIFVSANGIINVNMPVYGKNQSIGLVVERELTPSSNLQSSFIPLFPISTNSKTLLISVLLSFSFGYGLIFSRIGWWHYEFSQYKAA